MENKQKKIEIDEMQESNVFDLFVNKGVYSYVKDITYGCYGFAPGRGEIQAGV